MNVIIEESERGFLYKNGVYQRMLESGKHHIWPLFGETLQRVKIEDKLDFSCLNLSVLKKDALFTKSVAIVEVPDANLAIHFVDGLISGVLKPGIHAYCAPPEIEDMFHLSFSC